MGNLLSHGGSGWVKVAQGILRTTQASDAALSWLSGVKGGFLGHKTWMVQTGSDLKASFLCLASMIPENTRQASKEGKQRSYPVVITMNTMANMAKYS